MASPDSPYSEDDEDSEHHHKNHLTKPHPFSPSSSTSHRWRSSATGHRRRPNSGCLRSFLSSVSTPARSLRPPLSVPQLNRNWRAERRLSLFVRHGLFNVLSHPSPQGPCNCLVISLCLDQPADKPLGCLDLCSQVQTEHLFTDINLRFNIFVSIGQCVLQIFPASPPKIRFITIRPLDIVQSI